MRKKLIAYVLILSFSYSHNCGMQYICNKYLVHSIILKIEKCIIHIICRDLFLNILKYGKFWDYLLVGKNWLSSRNDKCTCVIISLVTNVTNAKMITANKDYFRKMKTITDALFLLFHNFTCIDVYIRCYITFLQ